MPSINDIYDKICRGPIAFVALSDLNSRPIMFHKWVLKSSKPKCGSHVRNMSNQQAQHVGRQFVSTKSRSIANWVSMHCNMISMDTSPDCTTDTRFFLRIHHCHHLITPETPLSFFGCFAVRWCLQLCLWVYTPHQLSICDILVSITTPTPTVSHSYWSYFNSISLQELVQHCPKGPTPCRSFHSKADAWILWSGACEQGGLGHVP